MSRRHRGVGIRGIKQQRKVQVKFNVLETKSKELESTKLADMQSSLKKFKEELEKFARKHKKEINKDPSFRAQFNNMCMKIGVDPLASNKGFWADMLGVGDFYYELSIQIIEICLKTRKTNGGLIEMYELLSLLRKKRNTSANKNKNKNNSKIGIEDIKCSISKVKSLGNGFGIIKLGNKTMVKSVPIELKKDHIHILNVCSNTACCTKIQLKRKLNWPIYRIEQVLDLMLEESMCWIDEQSGDEIVYWFPSLWKKNEQN